MRTLIIFILISAALYISAQTHRDSIEFNYCYDTANKLRNTKKDSAFYWLNKAEELALQYRQKEWQAKVYNLKAILSNKNNQYINSLMYLEKALKLTQNKELKGKIFINLGNTLSELNYPYSAINYYKEAVQIFHQINNQQFLVRALMNLSAEEFTTKQIIPARNHLKLALHYARENDFTEEEAMCLNNLSYMFIDTKQFDSASRYIYQSFNAYEKTENYYGLADAYLTAISLHLSKEEKSYAKALIDLADSIIDQLKYLDGKKQITKHKVIYYLMENDSKKASKYFNEYVLLEDSINRIKSLGNNINTSISNNAHEEKHAQSNDHTFLYIQLVFILLIALLIVFYLFKNYRNVGEE